MFRTKLLLPAVFLLSPPQVLLHYLAERLNLILPDKTPPALAQMTCAAVADTTFTTTSPFFGGSTTQLSVATQSVTTTTPCNPITVPTVTSNPGTPGSTASPTTGASTLTPPTPIVTQPARTTTTAFVKTPYSKDVIILLDDSKAVQGAKNFNSVTKFKKTRLFALIIAQVLDHKDTATTMAYR